MLLLRLAAPLSQIIPALRRQAWWGRPRGAGAVSTLRGMFYRTVMRLAHRFNWHYAPLIGPISAGDSRDRLHGGYQRWCQWCGFRESYPAPLRPIVGDAYDSVQPIASPHADPVTLEAGSVPPGFRRAQRQRKERK